MFQTLKNAWKVPEIRKKLLYTFLIFIIYRLGGYIPVPFLDSAAIAEMIEGSNNLFSYLNTLSGGTFSRATLLCLSVSPYINAQIIMQLLTFAIPALERMAKEGEEGRKKIGTITKILALVIAAFQSWAYYLTLKNAGALTYTDGFSKVLSEIIIIACFTAGAMLTIWLGSLIDKNGIGNGMSMLIFAGIVAELPQSFGNIFATLANTGSAGYIILIPVIIIIFILMIAFIVFMDNAERRVPIQYAKRVVGRKVYGGQSTYLPIKVSMAGVLPIIFAMSFMSIPQTIAMFTGEPTQGTVWYTIYNCFSTTHPVYATLYFILIILFSYFYISMQYDPVEIANNLRQNNGGIPGIRPGKPTSDYITRIVHKLTFVGAVFLGIVAIFPIIFAQITGISNLALGGTSILIVVSVALETVRQLESQLMMRHYKGFLD
ncbi:MAG: preprotein translocase subunit SecY [Oscillospiraceae bacterium]|nr:preprotein translocase subunit SecY [Ruminococcus sp.]MCD8345136.1 preprotein translocase subunit SecY [Oscillospiraceae bacterium]